MSRQIFISYSHVDASFVAELTALLKEAKVLYFLDRKDIDWGAPITPKVQSGLASSSAVLVIISEHSRNSEWVPYEVGYATALRIQVLPFLTTPTIALPNFLRELNAISSIDQFKTHWLGHRLPSSPL